ncbi:MAG TPA: ATP synthase F1 subunit delta [Phycisphaerales bacterium]|nr:ATP synthase F1 subunit delta [Phycisphaerales bacterium]
MSPASDNLADALSQVYARSLYELASTAGGESKVNEIADELEQVCELLRGNRQLQEFFASPVIDHKARSQSLSKIFGNRVTDLTLRFLLVLNENQRLGKLEGINAAYQAAVQAAFGRVEVDVYTPAPVESAQLESMRSALKSAIGAEPVLHCYTDPKMIGGVKFRIGDQLIDGSVANKLRRLKQSFLSSGGASFRESLSRFIDDSGRSHS